MTGETSPPGGVGPELQELLARATDPRVFEEWRRRAKATGWCRHPVRLVGVADRVNTTTGEIVGHFASSELPDRVVLKACGRRRATRCPTCSERYQADAYQLVAAGLRGGKGVPESVADHPMIFATLTAPSFGPVHRSTGERCHPARGARGVCCHGVPRSCAAIHGSDDPALGQPICSSCFDYPSAVVWNALAGKLWQRTAIGIRRSLATLAGVSRRELAGLVRVSFSKVVEYQRRGSVHLHVVIRLDAAGDGTDPPPPPFGAKLLSRATAKAATSAWLPSPLGPSGRTIRWGSQVDVRPIGDGETVPRVVASYVAKYSTKSTDSLGVLDRRLRESDLDRLEGRLSPHLATMVHTAWELGGRPQLEELRLRAWAHTLGFRGHWLTKSRRYSTTLTRLRAARQSWHLAQDGEGTGDDVVSSGSWHYVGSGWATEGDAWLAETAARGATDARRTGRFERRATTRREQANARRP
ncbi:MAG: replication initiator [Acidimicrobiales bacterium]